jgi:Ca2+-binding RTX toxin-like protein
MSTAFQVILTGTQEVPPTPSTASGLGTVIFDDKAVTASYSFDIRGVDFGAFTPDGAQTVATDDDVTRTHFHNQLPGVNGNIVFGQIDTVNAAFVQDGDDFDIVLNADGSWTLSGVWETTDPPAPPTTTFPEGATIADFAPVLGSAPVTTAVPLYFNVHTSEFGGGEIRGQLVVIADDNDNVVTGTLGNDRLPGLDGNDTIRGLAGNDMLQGGDGKDSMNGGVGNDTLTGGKGPDLFVFNAGFGNDIITDFQNNDRIQFEDGLFQDAQAVLDASHQDDGDTVITVGTNTITLQGVQLSSLHEHDFLILA